MMARTKLVLHVIKGDFRVLRRGNDVKEGGEPELDPEVWSQLPVDVLGKVLLKLPYAAKIKFRAVSKFWCHSLLREDILRSRQSSFGSTTTSPLICALEYLEDHESFIQYDLLDQSSCGAGSAGEGICSYSAWHLDLSFLPKEVSGWRLNDCFSQQGLIGIYNARSANELAICLLNPMTRTWKILPTLVFADQKKLWNLGSECQEWRIKLQVDKSDINNPNIEVVLLLPGSLWEEFGAVNMSVSAICLYTSTSNAWTVTKCVDDHAFRSFPRALCNGLIYTLNYHQWLTTHSLHAGRLRGAYDLQSLQSFSAELVSSRPFLVEHRGHVYCVQEICRVNRNSTFGVWKLNTATKRWTELSMVPTVLHEKFISQMFCSKDKNYGLSSVKSVGACLCLVVYSGCKEYLKATHSILVHLLVCHVPSWRWSIGFNNMAHRKSQIKWELFEPCLDLFL